MISNTDKTIIGRAEPIAFPEIGLAGMHARIDTGATTSALWATAEVVDDRLRVVFLGPDHPAYTGKAYYFDEYAHGNVASSNGQAEMRFRIKLLTQLGGRKIRTTFTLADRSTQVYPALIGRNTLRGKFVVDVKTGAPLRDEERKRSAELQGKDHRS